MRPTPELAQRDTLQDIYQANIYGARTLYLGIAERGPILPPWGSRQREMALRRFYRNEYNTLIQGAFQGLIKKVISTDWEVKGGKQRAAYFTALLQDAHFGVEGSGWGALMNRTILDYLRQDGGAYWELIAPGDPMQEPTGAIVGIAHLDSYFCLPTGDPTYPVVYWSRKGHLHLMHRSRVLHFVDMPDGDQWNPGYGLCALSRAIAVVERQMLMSRYIRTELDDLPAPGILAISNVTQQQMENQISAFIQRNQTDQPDMFGKMIQLFSLDPANPIKIDSYQFSRPPEKFDYKTYVEVDVDELALALGVDKQELWQLSSSGSMGSGAQSKTLHQKSQAKTYGVLLALFERAINSLMPNDVTFNFKLSDPDAELQQAQIAAAWAGFTVAAAPTMQGDEPRQLLANQIPAYQDVTTDDQGQLIELDDTNDEPATVTKPDDGTQQNGMEQQLEAEAPGGGAKEIQSTRLDFESDFGDLLDSARSGDTNRRRFGAILRDLIRKYGDKAYRDGLAESGIDEMDEDDRTNYLSILAEQSHYVTSLGDTLFKDGISNAQAAQKAEMWFKGSIQPFNDAGRMSANANGLYIAVGSDGKESCPDCKRLKGQVHRLKAWKKRNLMLGTPGQDTECQGFNCDHHLVRAEAGVKAQGDW